MKKAVKIIIFGTVQGVFFRTFIKENADKLSIAGFIRNLEDGNLEIWAEGDSKQVNEMIEICRQGPKHAQIKRLDIIDEKFQGIDGFKILKI